MLNQDRIKTWEYHHKISSLDVDNPPNLLSLATSLLYARCYLPACDFYDLSPLAVTYHGIDATGLMRYTGRAIVLEKKSSCV